MGVENSSPRAKTGRRQKEARGIDQVEGQGRIVFGQAGEVER